MFASISKLWSSSTPQRRRTVSSPLAFRSGCEVLESRQVLSATSVAAAVAGPVAGVDVPANQIFRLEEPIDARAILIQRNADAEPRPSGVIPGLKAVKLPEGMVIHGIILQNGLADPPPEIGEDGGLVDPPPEIILQKNGAYLLSEPLLARGLLVSFEVEGQSADTPVVLETFHFPKPALVRGIIPCVKPGDETAREERAAAKPPETLNLPQPTTIDGLYVVEASSGSVPKLVKIPGGITSETIYGIILDGKPAGGKPVMKRTGEKITLDKPLSIKGFVVGPAPDGSGTPADPSALTMQTFDHAIWIVGLHLKRV
jgi:hypothetical protein